MARRTPDASAPNEKFAPNQAVVSWSGPWLRLARWLATCVVVAGVFALGCSGAPAGAERPARSGGAALGVASSELLPVEDDDATWGAPTAPVTVVAFLDFECPFCARAHDTLQALQDKYGPERLRIVVKHAPLPFHARALPAALASQAVLQLAGDAAFFAYAEQLFENFDDLSERNLRSWALELGVPEAQFSQALGESSLRQQVDRDRALANELGVSGVPAFFVNGAPLVGALPLAEFEALIEHEQRAAGSLAARGEPASRTYAARVRVNLESLVSGTPAEPAWRVPLGDSPALGPDTAWVTIVEFVDLQCAFCREVHPRVHALVRKHAGRVRWVIKHNPLHFHPQAEQAALLAFAALEQRGAAAYFEALDLLMGVSQLNADTLVQVEKQLRLEPARTRTTVALGANHPRLRADRDLALDLDADGTPQFFINGRRLSGAQPDAVFEARIQEELELVSALLSKEEQVAKDRGAPTAKQRTPYERVQELAAPPPGLTRLQVETPGPDVPSQGPPSAPVVVQMFTDFQCGFCRRVMPTLDALRARYPEHVRLVWRHLPLPFHPQALPAARLALAVRERHGDAAFWKLAPHLLGGAEKEPPPLDTENLVNVGQAFGLATDGARAALTSPRFDAQITRDVQLAESLGINGTPSFVINGYRLVGAQPLPRFERLVRLALEESRAEAASEATSSLSAPDTSAAAGAAAR